MKLNKKGFMLAEIVIVSAVIIVTIMALYKVFADTYNAFEIRDTYYDAKTVYALKNFENFLIDDLDNSYLNKDFENYIEFNKNENDKTYKGQFINNFFDTYNISSLYIVKYNNLNLNISSALEDSFVKKIDSDFQDYIDFYINNTENLEYDNYNYILVALTNDGKYSSLRIN